MWLAWKLLIWVSYKLLLFVLDRKLTSIRPAMLYGTEFWASKVQNGGSRNVDVKMDRLSAR